MKLEKNERLEDLQCGGLKIIQNSQLYTFTSDSVILANFISSHSNDEMVEIGTGCGVISILLSAKTKFKKIYAFELQSEMALLAQKNLELNNLEDKIEVICDDIKNFEKHVGKKKFDVVFSNPPYMKEDVLNENTVKANARHEKTLDIKSLCKISADLLKENGSVYFVYPASRSAELIYSLMENKLEPKEMFFTENGKGKTILFVVKAVKGGKHEVKVYPNLATNDKNGDYIEKLHTKNFI